MFLRRLARHTIIYGASSILTRLLNWLLTPLYVNLFHPQEFGVVSELYALLFFPYTFLMFGMETTFFRHTETPLEAKKAFSTTFTIVILHIVLFAFFIGIFFHPLIRFLGYENRPFLLVYVVLILILDCLTALPMAYLRYQERSLRYAFITIFSIFLNLSLNIYFILYLRLGIDYIFLSNVASSFIKLVLSIWSITPLEYKWERNYFSHFYRYGAFIMLAGILGAINELLDRILLPRLWIDGALFAGAPRTGYELNGIYSANYKLAMFITLFLQAFRYASEPIFFKEKEKREKNIALGYYYLVLLGGFFCFLVSMLRYEIATFPIWDHVRLIPEAYEVGLSVVPILLLANLAFGSYVYFSIWFKIQDKTEYGLFFSLVGAIITLFVNVFFIPTWGFYACAWATLLAYGSMAVLCYLYGQRNYPIAYPVGKLVLYLFLLIGLFFIGERGGLWRWLSLSIGIVVGGFYFWRGYRRLESN